MLGQRVTAKDLADWHHRSQTLLAAIMYHSLTDLAGGIGFAPQLMQDAFSPQRNSDGEGMRQYFRQRQSVAAQRQRTVGVAELT